MELRSLKTRIVNKIIWGIYDGNSLYINAARIGMIKGYIRIEKLGRYSYFKGIPIISISQQDKMNNSAVMFGATGSIITKSQIANENKNNVNYVLNLETGMVNLLNKSYLLLLLDHFPDLIDEYNQEDKNESIEVILKYLDLLNRRVKS